MLKVRLGVEQKKNWTNGHTHNNMFEKSSRRSPWARDNNSTSLSLDTVRVFLPGDEIA
jgi:hypothetical protein